MRKNLGLRFAIILIVLIVSFVMVIPSLGIRDKVVLKEQKWAPSFLKKILEALIPKQKVKLGLDLKGGVYLVLDVVTSNLPKGASTEKAVISTLEVLRARLDALGLTQPLIQRQGKTHIVIQLPGEQNPQRAIRVIKQVARLEFKLVDDSRDPNEYIDKEPPPGYELLWVYVKNKETGKYEKKNPLLVKKIPEVSGEDIKDAYVGYDELGKPEVRIRFTSKGALKFARTTRLNVKKRLAIVLDNKIISAPIIEEPIPGGNAVIRGDFSVEEAKDLAIVLRAGALPAPVKVIENRTVGPSLGKDSIEQGLRAIAIGFVAVVLLMLIRYRFAGLIANLALLFNLLIIMAAMAGFGATLTLPGIAGLVLTVGMSVDANVIIFERIREELKEGKSLYTGIEAGYDRAYQTIVDANITTLITALALYLFGTGPVKGFAVTLSIGIVSSMFTAIFVTRTIFDWIALTFKRLRFSF